MKKIYIFLAEGFEEIEGLTVVDLLRRGGLSIEMVSISDSLFVTGAHGIQVKADCLISEIDGADGDMIVLPGGMPGTTNLKACEGLRDMLLEYNRQNKKIAAICAAPSVLGELGILDGKTAVCYPGFESFLSGAKVTENNVELCDNVITSRGPGTAFFFSLAILSVYLEKKDVEEIRKGLIGVQPYKS